MLRVNGANVLSGVDGDGRYAVHAGRKGETYRVLPVNPLSAEEIAGLREDAGMTRKEFSQVLGVSLSAVTAWENGKKSPGGAACRLLDMMRKDKGLIKKYVR